MPFTYKIQKSEGESMQKTRIGISVGMMGAAAYFLALLGDVWGYLLPILVAIYVLKFEENEWLRRTVVKVVVIIASFTVLVATLTLIPNLLGFVDDIANIFNENVSVNWLNRTVTAIVTLVNLCEKVLLLLLCGKSLRQSTIPIPVIDTLISKYM